MPRPRFPSGPVAFPTHERLVASIVALERFQVQIHHASGREEMLALTLNHLGWLLPLQTAGFYFPEGPDQDFVLRTPLEPAAASRLSRLVNQAIDSGRFGWALRHPRPALFASAAGGEVLILGALRTRRRVLGMFAAIMASGSAPGWDAHLPIVATYLAGAANAARSEELTLELQDHNRRLDSLVQQRTRQLELTAAQLAESQRLIRGAAEATRCLLTSENLDPVLPQVAGILGEASRSDRVGIGRRRDPAPDAGAPDALERIEWRLEAAEPRRAPAEPLPDRWHRALFAGHPVIAPGPDAREEEQLWLGRQGVRTLLLTPIFSADHWWGCLQLEACRIERHWSAGEVETLVTVANNIGLAFRREQHALQLRAAKDAAEVANRAKDRFLATISHELRTPLSAILGYAQLLRRLDHLPASAAGHISAVQHSADHLLGLINDLLDLAKAEVTRIELNPVNTPLRQLVAEAASIVHPRAEEKRLAFSCTLDPGVPEALLVDARRLRQVLINLLGNAVKFTRQGSVELNLSPSNGGVRLRVTDTGPGLGPEEIARLGRPFQQVGNDPQRSEGSGLGLAISRKILQAMGAELSIESVPGQGSSFWFDLPAPSGPDAPSPERSPRAWSLEFPPSRRAQGAAADPDRIRQLRQLAARGEALGLQRSLEAWAAESSPPDPFAEQLLELARSFRIKALRQLLDDP